MLETIGVAFASFVGYCFGMGISFSVFYRRRHQSERYSTAKIDAVFAAAFWPLSLPAYFAFDTGRRLIDPEYKHKKQLADKERRLSRVRELKAKDAELDREIKRLTE